MRLHRITSYLGERISLPKASLIIFSPLVCVLITFFFLHAAKGECTFWPSSSHAGTLYYLSEKSLGKEILPSGYLAELLELSSDMEAAHFSQKKAQNLLLSSPVIRSGQLRLLPPHTIQVEYSLRTPLALVKDFDNIAIDSEKILFPLRPFFTPKKLPSFYLGLDRDHPWEWNTPLEGEKVDLCFQLLSLFENIDSKEGITVRMIDVSNALAPSLGRREVVVEVVDQLLIEEGGENKIVFLPRYLRLRTEEYRQQIENYLQLRQEIFQKEKEGILFGVKSMRKIIDMRLPQTAYIGEEN